MKDNLGMIIALIVFVTASATRQSQGQTAKDSRALTAIDTAIPPRNISAPATQSSIVVPREKFASAVVASGKLLVKFNGKVCAVGFSLLREFSQVFVSLLAQKTLRQS